MEVGKIESGSKQLRGIAAGSSPNTGRAIMPPRETFMFASAGRGRTTQA
jgi:hypothetical protein